MYVKPGPWRNGIQSNLSAVVLCLLRKSLRLSEISMPLEYLLVSRALQIQYLYLDGYFPSSSLSRVDKLSLNTSIINLGSSTLVRSSTGRIVSYWSGGLALFSTLWYKGLGWLEIGSREWITERQTWVPWVVKAHSRFWFGAISQALDSRTWYEDVPGKPYRDKNSRRFRWFMKFWSRHHKYSNIIACSCYLPQKDTTSEQYAYKTDVTKRPWYESPEHGLWHMTGGPDKVSTTPAVPGNWAPSLLNTAEVFADGVGWPNKSCQEHPQECYVVSRVAWN